MDGAWGFKKITKSDFDRNIARFKFTPPSDVIETWLTKLQVEIYYHGSLRERNQE